MRRPRTGLIALALALAVVAAAVLLLASGCGESSGSAAHGRPQIVVTTPMLGAVVRDVVGDGADVQVLMPNGADPHEWRPSARDVAAVDHADLLVRNGLGLEGGLQEVMDEAQADGVPVFTATDHIDVRHVGAGETGASTDADRQQGAADPHFWTDPLAMRKVVLALPAAVKGATGLDVAPAARREAAALSATGGRVARVVATVPQADRTLVTGHESLGYFARRYGFRVVGAVTPSLSSVGQASARHVADLADAARANHVGVVFGEEGTPAPVAQAVADQAGASFVELVTTALPASGGYPAFMDALATDIATALGGQTPGRVRRSDKSVAGVQR